jgi:hypothetical protein
MHFQLGTCEGDTKKETDESKFSLKKKRNQKSTVCNLSLGTRSTIDFGSYNLNLMRKFAYIYCVQ